MTPFRFMTMVVVKSKMEVRTVTKANIILSREVAHGLADAFAEASGYEDEEMVRLARQIFEIAAERGELRLPEDSHLLDLSQLGDLEYYLHRKQVLRLLKE